MLRIASAPRSTARSRAGVAVIVYAASQRSSVGDVAERRSSGGPGRAEIDDERAAARRSRSFACAVDHEHVVGGHTVGHGRCVAVAPVELDALPDQRDVAIQRQIVAGRPSPARAACPCPQRGEHDPAQRRTRMPSSIAAQGPRILVIVPPWRSRPIRARYRPCGDSIRSARPNGTCGKAGRPSATSSRAWSRPMVSARVCSWRAGRRQDLARPRGPDPAPARSRHRRARVRGPRRARAELRGRAVGVRDPAERERAAGRVHRRARCRTRSPGQQFVFIVDDVDLACADERVTSELSELFTKVVSRSAGRARFLFVCASERMARARRARAAHRLAVPAVATATSCRASRRRPRAQILDRVLSLSGVAADPALAEAVVRGLDRGARPARGGSADRRDGDARPARSRRSRALQSARRPDRARERVAARRRARDRQRALGAAAVRGARAAARTVRARPTR